jgi:hypothetical protein
MMGIQYMLHILDLNIFYLDFIMFDFVDFTSKSERYIIYSKN